MTEQNPIGGLFVGCMIIFLGNTIYPIVQVAESKPIDWKFHVIITAIGIYFIVFLCCCPICCSKFCKNTNQNKIHPSNTRYLDDTDIFEISESSRSHIQSRSLELSEQITIIGRPIEISSDCSTEEPNDDLEDLVSDSDSLGDSFV